MQSEWRELIRYRRSLTDERAREVNRIQKGLEGANIKLSSVASDVLGKSARAMIEALIAGETDPEVLSGMALRRMKHKKDELKRSLNGFIGGFEEDLERLDTIPGVGRRTAEQIVAEAGTDMNRFPSTAH